MNKSKEFRVNDYITLKLQKGESIIYVNKCKFTGCKYLLLNVDLSEVEKYDRYDSLDEVIENLDHSMEGGNSKIDPGVEFWAHCSNLQAWAESDYDTRLLDKSLAFPLLKELSEVGDTTAKRVFKEEVARRFNSNYAPVQEYLIEEGYLKDFEHEELEVILEKSELSSKDLVDKGYLGFVNLITDKNEKKELTEKHKELDYFLHPEEYETLEALHLNMREIITLPNSVGELTGLKWLELKNNKLQSLPDSIGNLTSLKWLDLYDNNLSSLPTSVRDLKNLKKLYLAKNESDKRFGKRIKPLLPQGCEIKYIFNSLN